MKKSLLGLVTVLGLANCSNRSSPSLAGSGGSPLGSGGCGGSGGAWGSPDAAIGTGGSDTGGKTSTDGATGSGSGGVVDSGGASGSGGIAASGGATTLVGMPGSGGSTVSSGSGGAGKGGTGSDGATTGRQSGTGGQTGNGGTSIAAGVGPPETQPLGYGQNTTGGGSIAAVDVNSTTAMQAAIDAYSGSGGLTLRYTGTFNFSSIPDPCTQWNLGAQTVEIKKKNDITILGADDSAANFGIHIASSSSNIIVRNMTFGLLPGGGNADVISLEGMSGGVPTNIWIDHNELFSSMAACAGAGDSSFDGLIDVKKGADKVTVSYNYLHDHHKVSLNGFSDTDTSVRHVTFHHNIFQNVGSRTPLQRAGFSHLLNNYFNQIETSGANIRMGGYSLIEGNYFENAQNPVTSRDSTAIGYWELRSNNIVVPADFTTYKITWVSSSSAPTVDATSWTTTATYPEALGYAYTADPPACLKSGLASVAGAGKGLATLKCK